MAQTVQEERWRWLKPIIHKEMRLVDVAKVCPHSARSLNHRHLDMVAQILPRGEVDGRTHATCNAFLVLE